MRIVDQNGMTNIPYELSVLYIERETVGDKTCHVIYAETISKNNIYILGVYGKTEAKEVFDEIVDDASIDMKVYKMPPCKDKGAL